MVINFIVLIALIVFLTWLQIFLSKQENKWLGLIIPSIFLLSSVYIILMVVVPDDLSMIEIALNISRLLLFSSIPFFYNLIIYLIVRKTNKKSDSISNEIDKMKIRDL